MKRAFVILAALIVAGPLMAQRIETRVPSENQIVRVATALNHLTVIELREPVLSVAAGSDAFKIEWRGNKVFVEPTEASVATNLFIWTKSGRENYELEPAGSVSTMDFALDTAAPDPPQPSKVTARAISPAVQMAAAMESMFGGTPVRLESWRAAKDRVQVCVRDLFEQGGILYLRYSIENRTKQAYSPGVPRITKLTGGLSQKALAGLVDTQLSRKAAAGLRTSGEAPRPVAAHAEQEPTVLPGEVMIGVVAMKMAAPGSAVLRLEFNTSRGQSVSAVVVI